MIKSRTSLYKHSTIADPLRLAHGTLFPVASCRGSTLIASHVFAYVWSSPHRACYICVRAGQPCFFTAWTGTRARTWTIDGPMRDGRQPSGRSLSCSSRPEAYGTCRAHGHRVGHARALRGGPLQSADP